MKATLEVNLEEFKVPDYVFIRDKVHDRFSRPAVIALSEIPELTLQKMCDNFVYSIFQKANKKE